MTASGLPAALTRLAISVEPAGASCGPCPLWALDDMADIAESMDEFLGAPDSGSTWAAVVARSPLAIASGIDVAGEPG